MKKILPLVTLLLCFLSACGLILGQEEEMVQGENKVSAMNISLADFNNGQPVPQKFTCDGENVSPALSWSGAPAQTASYALIVDDPDAPVGVWVHWVLYNLPPTLNSLAEKSDGVGTQGMNGWRTAGYSGPCPPAGKAHRYYFKIYALDLPPDLPAGLTASQLTAKMKGHLLAQAEWMGTYGR